MAELLKMLDGFIFNLQIAHREQDMPPRYGVCLLLQPRYIRLQDMPPNGEHASNLEVCLLLQNLRLL